MTTRKSKPPFFLYTDRPPVRWLQAAAAMLDESLATLCARQWQRARFIAIEPSDSRECRRRLR